MDPAYDVVNFPAKAKVSRPQPVDGTRVTILGCGTSTGVPYLACSCRVCTSIDPRNNRTRASITIQARDRVFLIDASPDLRAQAFRNHLLWIDAVLFTHPHADHIHGLDDLRSFNYIMARRISCYGNAWTLRELKNRFSYIFRKTQLGGGKPMLDLCLIDRKREIEGVPVQPLKVGHGKLPVLGFRIGNAAYITDCNSVPAATFRAMRNLDVLVLDCLRNQPHPTHLNVAEALALAEKIGAKRTVLTHMSHDLEYAEFAANLPRGVEPAYDGLVIDC